MSFIRRLFISLGGRYPLDYVGVWRTILFGGDTKSWVLFENGTVVIFMQPDGDLQELAIDLMKEWGLDAGCFAGDFSTLKLTNNSGWVVTCHHNDILTYVSPDGMAEKHPTDIVVGLHGRGKRHLDAESPNVIHVEDKRGEMLG
jgi:hypothetical protein